MMAAQAELLEDKLTQARVDGEIAAMEAGLIIQESAELVGAEGLETELAEFEAGVTGFEDKLTPELREDIGTIRMAKYNSNGDFPSGKYSY
jgi:hypothetical protein